MIEAKDQEIINRLLLHEHQQVAYKLGFIDVIKDDIDDKLLIQSISLINDLKEAHNEESKKIIITLASILWTYQKAHWSGLNEFLINVLSKIGYAPSSIMVDHNYDHSKKCYSRVSSLLSQYAITVNQLKNEVVVKDKVYLLTEFQKKVWLQIENNKTLGVSAPTSAGKSFVIALKAIDLIIQESGTIIYIVPTLSLVSQVAIDFRKLLEEFNLNDYEISTSYNDSDENTKKIFVLTQEKAIGAFAQKAKPFKNIRLLVVDEIQNVERVAYEDDQRSKTLYDLLIEFRHTSEIHKIVISGPRIEKIGDLCDNLFGKGAVEEKATSSPVASFTYSMEILKGKKVAFKQHADIQNKPTSITFSPKYKFPKANGKHYNEQVYDFIHRFLEQLGKESINIIFSPTPPQSRKTALALSKRFPAINSDKLDSLIAYLSETVHTQYSLCDTLKAGVVYHHGKIPHHVRRSIERAVTDKLINHIACTTTLMQGVNLPAHNVIIRNPNLYIKTQKDSTKLTQYEISNLRGRAGRLLKDFIGRTFILDENAFELSTGDEAQVFEDEYKKLKSGYGETFEDHRTTITSDLLNNVAPAIENKAYGFLLSYIRQMILRYGPQARQRFHSVGINLSQQNFEGIQQSLKKLRVPREIVIKNRYWDPLDIDTLYLARAEFDLPLSINESNIATRLEGLINQLDTLLPIYKQRYFNVEHSYLPICICAEKWLKEKPLKEILSGSYYDSADKIERTIEILQNNVSYGLPLLIKPLYDIISPNSSFLRFIETGSYQPVTRRLIEHYNIPRETAISLRKNYLPKLNAEDPEFDKKLKALLRNNLPSLNYWEQSQLEALIPSTTQ